MWYGSGLFSAVTGIYGLVPSLCEVAVAVEVVHILVVLHRPRERGLDQGPLVRLLRQAVYSPACARFRLR
mgnify:CR=1 FL=1